MGDDKPGHSGNALRTVGELGPAWITAITGLVATLTTAGFIVGHATAGSSAAPQPTVTITKTIQVGAGAAVNPAPSATGKSSAGSTNSTAGATGVANGTQLGSYSIDLSMSYSVPLGATKPTQAQFSSSSSGGDLYFNGGVEFRTGLSSEELVSLPDGATPTYQACSTATTFVDSAGYSAGTSFCVIETAGKLAGVYVSSEQSSYAVLQVTVWQYAS